MRAGQANADHVATLGFMPEIGDPVYEIPGTVLVVRQHADAFNADGQQDESENHEAGDDQNHNPHQGRLGIAADHHDLQPAGHSRLLPAGICLSRLVLRHHAFKFRSSCQQRKRRLLRGFWSAAARSRYIGVSARSMLDKQRISRISCVHPAIQLLRVGHPRSAPSHAVRFPRAGEASAWLFSRRAYPQFASSIYHACNVISIKTGAVLDRFHLKSKLRQLLWRRVVPA